MVALWTKSVNTMQNFTTCTEKHLKQSVKKYIWIRYPRFSFPKTRRNHA